MLNLKKKKYIKNLKVKKSDCFVIVLFYSLQTVLVLYYVIVSVFCYLSTV